MLADVLYSNSLIKLRGMIQNRYGMDLKINFINEISAIDLSQQTPSIIEGDLHIFITPQSKYMATVVVKNGAELETEEKYNVFQLIKMILEPVFFSAYLDQQEQNQKAHRIQQHPSDLSGQVILLESNSPFSILKYAIEIQDITERWAHMPYFSIKSQITRVSDLFELGRVVISIDDILTLNGEEQMMLCEFLLKADPTLHPLIVIGTSTESSLSIIDQHLASVLNDKRIQLQSLPLETKKLRESLELFFTDAFNA